MIKIFPKARKSDFLLCLQVGKYRAEELMMITFMMMTMNEISKKSFKPFETKGGFPLVLYANGNGKGKQ